MLSPQQLAELPPNLTLDELWTAGLNEDQSRYAADDRLARLQAWVVTHCTKPVAPPKAPAKGFLERLGL